MLEVWGRASSGNVQAVMWCIGELGLPYKRHDIGHRYGGNKTPEYLAMNPNATVPTVRDGEDGEPLFESAAIIRYLAARYSKDDTFWPKDDAARARVDMWAEWAKLNVALNFGVPVFWGVYRTPPSKRDPVAIRKAMDNLDKYLDIAEAQLSSKGPYLAGENFTVADLQMGYTLQRYYDIDIERKDRPVLRKYYELLKSRPAFQEHVMVDYSELKVTD